MVDLRSLRIGPRVWLGFAGGMLALVLAVGAVEISRAQVARQNQLAEQGQGRLAATNSVRVLARDNAIDSLQMLVSPSEDQQKKLAQGLEARNAQIAKELTRLGEGLTTTEDQARVAEVAKRHLTYEKGVKRIAGMVIAGKQSEAAFAADEEMTPMMLPFLKALEELQTHEEQRARQATAQVDALLNTTRNVALLAGLMGVLLSGVAGVLIVRSLTRPIEQAVALAQRVGGGDLSHRVPVRGRDEVSQLLDTMNQMSARLGQVIDEVRRGSDEVASASAQIAQGNQDLSQRTEQQAAALQQAASSMDQLGSTVKQTAAHAAEANRMAQGASQTAQSGGAVVEEVVQTMRAINESSRRIADITGVIDGIAFQTNILALNAAVEAARAGEQGRGFAVVASEVRSLAQRSADAAREIKGLIGTSVERVEAGTQQADHAGRAMQDIVTSIRRVTDIVGEITTASSEQSIGVELVGQAVTQMDQGTQQNTALVEQSAAAAVTLREQAQQLARTVERFRVEPASA